MKVKAGVAQVGAVPFNVEASLAKAEAWIAKAGEAGCEIEPEFAAFQLGVVVAQHARAQVESARAEDDPEVDDRCGGGCGGVEFVPQRDALDMQVKVARIAADLTGQQCARCRGTPAGGDGEGADGKPEDGRGGRAADSVWPGWIGDEGFHWVSVEMMSIMNSTSSR